MLEKLKKIEEKFDDINGQLCQSDVVSDIDRYTKLMRELKTLTPVVEKYRELKAAQSALDEARGMLDEGGLDKDFRELVREEFAEYAAVIL